MPNKNVYFSEPLEAILEWMPNTVIPFATGSTSVSISNSSSIMVTAFGNHSTALDMQLTGVAPQVYWVSSYNSYSFVTASNLVVKGIYMNVSNNIAWSPGGGASALHYPFVALATAPLSSNTFHIIPETKTYVETPYVPTGNPINTLLKGSKTDLNIRIPEGTRVGIVCGFESQGTTTSISTSYLFFSGAIAFG